MRAALLVALAAVACNKPAEPKGAAVAPPPAAGTAAAGAKEAAGPAGGAGSATGTSIPPDAAPATKFETAAWAASIEVPPSVKPGEAAVAKIRLTAKQTYHLNAEYPSSFRKAADATATFDADRLAMNDVFEKTACTSAGNEAHHCEATAPVKFTAPAAGEARVAGTFAFSVCDPNKCLIEKVPLAALVRAQ